MSLRLPAAVVALGLDPECRNMPDGAAADAGAGGADAPPMDAPAIEPEGAGRPETSAADVVDVDDDDASDTDDFADAPWRDDPRVKRILNRNRTLSRRVAKSREFVDTARALGLTSAQLRDVADHARRYNEALPVLRSPEFLEVATRLSKGTHAEPPRGEEPPPAFDDSEFPFDVNDRGGRYLHDFMKRSHAERHELVSLVRSLSRDLAQLRQGISGEQRTREVGNWRSAMDAAAAKVPENVNGIPLRMLFKDAIVGAFHMATQKGVRLNPQQVIAHYLKEFKLPSSTQAAAAAAAAKQRMAENNKTRPNGAAFAGGTPTKAGDRAQERVSDVSRRLLGRRYVGIR